MSALLRFVAAVALLMALVSMYAGGVRLPPWVAAVILVAGMVLLLYRGNLTRKLISIVGAIIALAMLSRRAGTTGVIGLIGLVALVFLAVAVMFKPWFGKRY